MSQKHRPKNVSRADVDTYTLWIERKVLCLLCAEWSMYWEDGTVLRENGGKLGADASTTPKRPAEQCALTSWYWDSLSGPLAPKGPFCASTPFLTQTLAWDPAAGVGFEKVGWAYQDCARARERRGRILGGPDQSPAPPPRSSHLPSPPTRALQQNNTDSRVTSRRQHLLLVQSWESIPEPLNPTPIWMLRLIPTPHWATKEVYPASDAWAKGRARGHLWVTHLIFQASGEKPDDWRNHGGKMGEQFGKKF